MDQTWEQEELAVANPIVMGSGELSIARAPAKRQKLVLTEIERAIQKHILPFLDKISYGTKTPDGKKWQVSRDRIEARDAALWRKRYVSDDARLDTTALIPKLAGRHIAAHQRGEYELLTRSSWEGGKLQIRFESDPQPGQTDDHAVIEFFKPYLPPMMIIPSDKGYSGYWWLEVPYYINDDGEVIPTRKLVWMNGQRELIHDYIKALAAENGFKCAIEAHGSFLRKHHYRDENKVPIAPSTVAEGALGPRTNVKNPRLGSVAEVLEFAAAVVKMDDPGFMKLMADGKAAFERQKTKAQRQAFADKKTAVAVMTDERIEAAIGDEDVDFENEAQLDSIIKWRPKTGQRAKVDRIIIGSDDKPKNARDCIVRARQILGIRTQAEFGLRRDEIIELAHTLYDENHLSQNSRDQDRDSRFVSAFSFLHKTFDDAKAGQGNDSNWYDEPHIQEVATKLTSTRGYLDGLAETNSRLKAKHRAPISTEYVADVGCCMGKNAYVAADGGPSEGDCSTVAVQRMMKSHGKRHDCVTVSEAMTLFIKFGPLDQIADAIKPEYQLINGIITKIRGRARRFVIRAMHWFSFLPQPATQKPFPAVTTDNTPKCSEDSDKGVAGPFSSSSRYKVGTSTQRDAHSMVIDLKKPSITLQNPFNNEISPKTPF